MDDQKLNKLAEDFLATKGIKAKSDHWLDRNAIAAQLMSCVMGYQAHCRVQGSAKHLEYAYHYGLGGNQRGGGAALAKEFDRYIANTLGERLSSGLLMVGERDDLMLVFDGYDLIEVTKDATIKDIKEGRRVFAVANWL